MKVVLCVKKAKPYLVDERKVRYHNFVLGDNSVLKSNEKDLVLNGKIVAECDFEVEEITDDRLARAISDELFFVERDNLLKGSCLTGEEIKKYLNFYNWKFEKEDKVVGYAIHIKNLNVFDKSRELKQYFLTKITRGLTYGFYNTPEIENERTIVISVTSQEACNILNHKQDILIRRNVLKEMK